MKSGIYAIVVGVLAIGCGPSGGGASSDSARSRLPCDATVLVTSDGQESSGALQQAVDAARPGEVIAVDPGQYGPLTLNRDLHLVGRNGSGECAPALGEGGPRVAGLQATEGTLRGMVVRGDVELKGSASASRVDVRDGAVTLESRAKLTQFLAVNAPLVAGGTARLESGLVVASSGPGVRLTESAGMDHVTVHESAGHGVVVAGEGVIVANVLAVNNGGSGLMEESSPRLLEHLGFAGNVGGAYASAEGEGAGPVATREREVSTVTVLMPGDRRGTEPALAVDGIVRASLYSTWPYASGGEEPAPGSSASDWARALRPGKSVHRARRIFSGTHDALGRPRGFNPPIGGLAWDAVEDESGQVLIVSPEGEDGAAGTLEAPLKRIQEAVDRASDGAEIRVLPGRYAESVFVRGKSVHLRGMRRVMGVWESILDPTSAHLPVSAPATTGASHFGLFLEDVLRPTRVEGIGIEGARTGIVVIGRRDDAPPAPVLSHLRLQDNEKGLDSDCGEGVLRSSLFIDNRIGASFRSANLWHVEGNRFQGDGNDLVFSMTMLHGLEGFRVVRNRFEGKGGIRVDSLLSRHGAALVLEENAFVGPATVYVRRGSPHSRVEVIDNAFQSPGGIVLHGLRDGAPGWETRGNTLDGRALDATWPEVSLLKPLGPGVVHPHAAPIARDPRYGRIAAVGADFGGIAVVDGGATTPRHVGTGLDPRGLAFTPDGEVILVANLGDGTLSFVDAASGEVQATIPVGVEPFGVVVHPDGKRAWVSLSGEGAVAKIDVEGRRVQRVRRGLAPKPRGLAIRPEGAGGKLFVSHFSPARGEEPAEYGPSLRPVLTVLDLEGPAPPREIALPPLETRVFPPAHATLMPFVVVRGDRVFVPAFGATPERPRGVTRKKRALAEFEVVVQALWYTVHADREVVLTEESSNLNVPGSILNGPYGVAFDANAIAHVVSYGNDSVARMRLHEGSPPAFVRPWRGATDLLVGANPRGAVLDPVRQRLWTVDFADGTMSVVDLQRGERIAAHPLGDPSRDRLSALARRGKRLFYATNRVASAADFWFTCGTCHPDGRTDGVTWRFPAGYRSTPSLAGSLDTLPLHFDADRDQFEDFEHTVRGDQGGFGLVRGAIPSQLGDPIAGGREWDAIVAYVREGIDAPRGLPGGEAAARGRSLYAALGCASCHGGANFAPGKPGAATVDEAGRMLAALKDVGTRSPGDEPDWGGFDPPSLWGVAQTAPYLHDGSASTLEEVLANERHLHAGLPNGAEPTPLAPGDRADLIAFLQTISEGTEAVD